MSFSKEYLEQFYSYTDRMLASKNDCKKIGLIIGNLVKSKINSETFIEIMNVWVTNIEKLLKLVDHPSSEKKSYKYISLYKQRGVTYKEFYYLFSKGVEEKDYAQYPVYLFSNTFSEELRNRRYGHLSYTPEDYIKFIQGFELIPIQYVTKEKSATISIGSLNAHSYCVAKTRSGKTELLKLIVYHLIEQKEKQTSLLILDPHGEVAREIRRFSILQNRIDDFVYLDPAINEEHTPVFNPFQIKTKDVSKLAYITDTILDAFQQLLRDQIITGNMRRLLRHCIYILLENDGTSIMDLYILLSALGKNRNQKNPEFKEEEVKLMDYGKNASDPITRRFFEGGWKEVDLRTISAVVERIDGILSHPLVRNFMVGQNSINLSEYLNTGKIVVVNLDFTKLGNIGSEAIGRLIVSEAQNISAQRNKLAKNQRPRTIIFMDECQRFVSAAIERALSEFGKFNTYLFLAHQYIEQIDDGMVKAMLSNTENKIVGRNSAASMGAISSDVGMSKDDLMMIKKYQFCIKISDQEPFIFQSSPILLDKPNNPFYVSEEKAAVTIDKYMIKKYYRSIVKQNGRNTKSIIKSSSKDENDQTSNTNIKVDLDTSDF